MNSHSINVTYIVTYIVLPPSLKQGARVCLKQAKPDERCILHPPYNQNCLDVRVSDSLVRALNFINAVILTLETERFPVSVQIGHHGTGAEIFGHRVPFALVEKARETGRREVKEYSWTKTSVDYVPSGQLEFRFGDYVFGRKHKDEKKQQLKALLSSCLVSLMREGRASLISAKLEEQRKIERVAKERERAELAGQIAEEEKKVKDLETWVRRLGTSSTDAGFHYCAGESLASTEPRSVTGRSERAAS